MRNRFLAGLVAACTAVALTAMVALGHAELVESDPPAGGVLEVTPYTLTATFDVELDAAASSIIVRNAGGDEVASGGVSDADALVMTAALPALEPGEYTVRWTAITPDDAGVERGSYTFTVGPAATPTPDAGPTVAGTNDVILALGMAAVAIAAVVGFVVLRRRR